MAGRVYRRNQIGRRTVSDLKVRKHARGRTMHLDDSHSDDWERLAPGPTPQFRRRAWLAFQRAIDPLAPPRPLPRRRPH